MELQSDRKMHVVDGSLVVRRYIADVPTTDGRTFEGFADSREPPVHVDATQAVAHVPNSLEAHPSVGLKSCRQRRMLEGARRPLPISVMTSAHGSRNSGEILDSDPADRAGELPVHNEMPDRL